MVLVAKPMFSGMRNHLEPNSEAPDRPEGQSGQAVGSKYARNAPVQVEVAVHPKCHCYENLTTDEAGSNETATSEEDLPEDFFDFEDSDHDQLEEVLDEDNALFSSESESELPEI